jgi:hypothetical protein
MRETKGAGDMPRTIAADKRQVAAIVDVQVAEELKAMAKAMNTSVSRLLGTLITVAMRSAGGTFEAFSSDLARLTGEKDE